MPEYAVLIAPSTNRVYAASAQQLMRAELQVFSETVVDSQIRDLSETTIGGVAYVRLAADGLTDADVAALSNVSSVYALFEVCGDLLRPLAIRPLDRFGSDLITIQKYSGKTNEHFTKLLLNVTAVATDSPRDFLHRPLRVLDPLCGRGTTLNQAMMYGFDASGMDIDAKDFDAYAHFIRTWLKNTRIKHTAETVTVRRDRRTLGRRLDITYGVTKEQYKAGDVRTVACVNADTLRANEFFKPESFDILVTDTPYGVQHGSSRTALSRSPVELLEAAVPVWVSLLRPGGALGMSWNTHVCKRETLAELLSHNGLRVAESEAYLGFRHRVDQAIVRDLIVARKN